MHGRDHHLAMVVVERGTSPNEGNDSWDIELHRMMVETGKPVVTSWLNREHRSRLVVGRREHVCDLEGEDFSWVAGDRYFLVAESFGEEEKV